MLRPNLSDTRSFTVCCPSCGSSSLQVIATVSAAVTERHFLWCAECRKTYVAEWVTIEGGRTME